MCKAIELYGEQREMQKAKEIAETVYPSMEGEPNERLAAYVNGFMDGARSMADKIRKEQENNGNERDVHKDADVDA